MLSDWLKEMRIRVYGRLFVFLYERGRRAAANHWMAKYRELIQTRSRRQVAKMEAKLFHSTVRAR